jgi:hypothetical protein
MPILDDRGRLFGRVNLIDAAVATVGLALIPLAYASWLFLRTPTPVLQTATPSSWRAGPDTQVVLLTGQHFRPYLRAIVGRAQTTYLFDSPTRAELRISALPPGVYDLFLYDQTQEVARLPQALTVVNRTPPVVTSVTPGLLEFSREPQRVVVKGERLTNALKATIGSADVTFTSPSPDRGELMAQSLPPGTFDLVLSDELGEVVRVPNAIVVPKPAIQRVTPSVLEYSRDNQRVELKGQHFLPGIRLFVGWREIAPTFESPQSGEVQIPPLPPGSYDLAIFDASGGTEYSRYPKAITIRPAQTVELQLRVRFVMRPEVLTLVKQTYSEAAPPGAPRLLSYEVGDELVGTTKAELKEGRVVIVDGVVQVPAVRRPDGWQFEGRPLKAGASFSLKSYKYQIDGDILSVETAPARAR